MRAKRIFVLCLSVILAVSCLAACGGTDSGSSFGDNSENQGMFGGSENNGPEGIIGGGNQQGKTPWIVEATKDAEYVSGEPFYEDLAFVSIRMKGELPDEAKSYFINREGEMVMACKGTMPAKLKQPQRFYNGLYLYEAPQGGCFANKKGEDITAESLGGTSLSTDELNYQMLENGYFFVDKIINDYQGATYESAIYNTNLEQVQPYSAELYEFLHDQASNISGYFKDDYIYFYNEYLYRNSSEEVKTQTYNIKTGTYEEYTKVPAFLETSDWKCVISGSKRKLYKGSTEIAEYDTLDDVVCVGDKAVALFENIERVRYFTVLDAEGNFQFDPIEYGLTLEFNGNIILTCTVTPDKKVVAKTFDLTGKELGCIEGPENSTLSNYYLSLGEDTIVVRDVVKDKKDILAYYDTNLNPLFSTE